MSGWIFVRKQSSEWTPASLSSLRAWYDADDPNTITESSGLISAWDDKSGGGYHLSSSGSDRPTYTSSGLNGKSVVTFNATHWMAASTASDWKFLHDSTGSSVFVVLQYTRADRMAFMWTSPFNSAKIGWTFCTNSAANKEAYNLIRGSGSWTVLNRDATIALPINTDLVMSVVCDPNNGTAGDRSAIRRDGGTAISANTQTGTPSTANPDSPLTLGRSGDSSMVGLEGFIAEVVICDDILSDADRQDVEGYLAWKWGLEGNLPNGHDHKTAAPTV